MAPEIRHPRLRMRCRLRLRAIICGSIVRASIQCAPAGASGLFAPLSIVRLIR